MSTHSNPEISNAAIVVARAADFMQAPVGYPDYVDLEGYRFVRRREKTVTYWDPRIRKIKQRTEYFLEAELTRKTLRCIFCGDGDLKILRCYRQGIRDRPIRGTPCTIEVDRDYLRCQNPNCGQRWSELLPHIDSRRNITDRLRNQVWDDNLEKSNSLISIETGLDEKQIRGIIQDGIAALGATRKIQWSRHVYMDEIRISPKKRHRGMDATIPLNQRARGVCGYCFGTACWKLRIEKPGCNCPAYDGRCLLPLSPQSSGSHSEVRWE